MRFVKHTAAKQVPSTRCWSSACDDTSIATVPTPASRIRASSCLQVGRLGRRVLRRRAASSPIARADRPDHTRLARPRPRAIDSSRYVVVVLPFVPVTPSTRSARDGSPSKNAAAQRAERGAHRRRRAPAATSTATHRSTRHATAPARTAPARSRARRRWRPGCSRTARRATVAVVVHDRSHVDAPIASDLERRSLERCVDRKPEPGSDRGARGRRGGRATARAPLVARGTGWREATVRRNGRFRPAAASSTRLVDVRVRGRGRGPCRRGLRWRWAAIARSKCGAVRHRARRRARIGGAPLRVLRVGRSVGATGTASARTA